MKQGINKKQCNTHFLRNSEKRGVIKISDNQNKKQMQQKIELLNKLYTNCQKWR
jgi:hypothetical protein